MMKILLNMIFLLVLHQTIYSQVPDTIPVMDTIAGLPKDTIPVLSDTTQYNDTTIVNTAAGTDTVVKKKVHSPRRATLRSLMIPGWGQVYNKKYWKVPLVYAAIGFPAYLFFDNRKWFNRTKYALSVVVNDRYNNLDSMNNVHPQLKALVDRKAQGALIDYRNEFRKNMDYSILFTILMWGLNIVDATVDGHLIGFDVGEELSFKMKPAMIQGSTTPGLTLVLNFK
jgi:Family of unknown function (DUF5683)